MSLSQTAGHVPCLKRDSTTFAPLTKSAVDSSDSSSQPKSIRERLVSIFRVDDSPHRVALAFAIGVFLAFFPVMGLHTILALSVAWVGRFSVPVLIAGTFVNNPWTIAPIYGGALWFGLFLTGSSPPSLRIEWKEMEIIAIWDALKPVLWPFCVGAIASGVIAGLIAYFIARPIIQAYQTRRAQRGSSVT